MARAGLTKLDGRSWTLDDLAEASGLGRATLARFELGQTVTPETVATIRRTLEANRVKFVEKGPLKGAVVMGLKPAP